MTQLHGCHVLLILMAFPVLDGAEVDDVSSDLCRATLCLVEDWPSQGVLDKLGQVSGVAVDPDTGDPVIFHRGDRVWDAGTFDSADRYTGAPGPIAEPTLLRVSAETGEILDSWGEQLFYMPHMLAIDADRHFWITDVALHQVFRFKMPESGRPLGQPSVVLGRKFEPGSDDDHLCKPTSVAVSEDVKSFFVADGYCNGRIIKYRLNDGGDAEKVMEWGRQSFEDTAEDTFLIPHSLALADDLNLLCVADREHGKIKCFNSVDGKFVITMNPIVRTDTVYGIAQAARPGHQLLYAVTGPPRPRGLIFDLTDGNQLDEFEGDTAEFKRPHDIAAAPDGSQVYVVELSKPYRVYKWVDNTSLVNSARTSLLTLMFGVSLAV